MAVVHVVRRESRRKGTDSWALYDPDGDEILVFRKFCDKFSDQKYATKKRYAEVASRFIDYLFEVGVLGGRWVSRSQLTDAITYYLQLLRDGENIRLGLQRHGTIEYEDEDDEVRESALRATARKLGITPLRRNSWSNTIAALNGFLRTCEELESEAREIAMLRGGVSEEVIQASYINYRPFIEAIEGSTQLTRREVKYLKASSMLGSLIRIRGGPLSRLKGVSAGSTGRTKQATRVRAFPMVDLPKLLEAATSWRDRTLWLSTAASGIRRSEALNLEWSHIDLEQQMVYVLDPDELRYGSQISEHERLNRFKGRSVSWTYLRQPFRDWFFEALLEYRKREYVLPEDGNDYVFQYVRNPHRGRPYREARDSTLNEAFVAAVQRAGIPGPPDAPKHLWTQHSFRHAYGYFMLNDFAIPQQAQSGLTLAEVQMLMGHESILTTGQYARPAENRLKDKLARHDAALLGYEFTEDLSHLPVAFAERLERAALTRKI